MIYINIPIVKLLYTNILLFYNIKGTYFYAYNQMFKKDFIYNATFFITPVVYSM